MGSKVGLSIEARDRCLDKFEYAVLASRVRVGFTGCKISESVFVHFTSHGFLDGVIHFVGLLCSFGVDFCPFACKFAGYLLSLDKISHF